MNNNLSNELANNGGEMPKNTLLTKEEIEEIQRDRQAEMKRLTSLAVIALLGVLGLYASVYFFILSPMDLEKWVVITVNVLIGFVFSIAGVFIGGTFMVKKMVKSDLHDVTYLAYTDEEKKALEEYEKYNVGIIIKDFLAERDRPMIYQEFKNVEKFLQKQTEDKFRKNHPNIKLQ